VKERVRDGDNMRARRLRQRRVLPRRATAAATPSSTDDTRLSKKVDRSIGRSVGGLGVNNAVGRSAVDVGVMVVVYVYVT